MSSIQEYIPNDSSRTLLSEHGLSDFATLWSLNAGWVEEPNQRRGGWSGVSKYALNSANAIYIKRQQNHVYRSWNTFFMPTSTFVREFKNLLRFLKCGIPTLELVYFGKRSYQGKQQAILVTRELEGFLPLDDAKLQLKLKSDFELRQRVISQIAVVVRHMHDHHLQHNCLYPKHIFIKELVDHSVDVRLIDLEKVKWKILKHQAMQRDLGTLHRHAEGWSKTDRLRMFLAYRQEKHLSEESRKILRTLLRRKKSSNRISKQPDARYLPY